MIGNMPALALNLRTLRDQSPEQWLQTLTRVGPGLVGAILVVALAWQLVQATWLFLGATGNGPLPGSIAPQAQPTASTPAVDLNALVGAHLFGIASSEPNPADVNTAPQTQMNLVLTGTMASADPQKGYAIVGESATTAKTYPTGATLRPGTKLHSVFTDRVILDNGGKLETLVLPRQFAGAAAPVRPPATSGNGVGDQLRQIAETNPSAFTSVVRPQPVFANGVQRGYRVYPGRDRKQFANLGLQPGDLVTSVNGTPLDDPSRGMEIFNSLNSSAQVTVTVERNGQTQQLSLNTAQLSVPQPAQAAEAPPEPPAGPIPTFESAPAVQQTGP
jgi:general secretion pathway protein C